MSVNQSHRVRTWRRAAEILGMDENTLKRHRDEHGCKMRRPFWRSEEAVLEWYETMIAPPEPPPKPSRKQAEPKPVRGRAVNLTEAAKEISRGIRPKTTAG
jgi:hypothetical protein